LPWGIIQGTPDELAASDDRRIIDFLSEEVAPAPEDAETATAIASREIRPG
jgi:hypothetical protein